MKPSNTAMTLYWNLNSSIVGSNNFEPWACHLASEKFLSFAVSIYIDGAWLPLPIQGFPLMETANDKKCSDARWQAQGSKLLEPTIKAISFQNYRKYFEHLIYIYIHEPIGNLPIHDHDILSKNNRGKKYISKIHRPYIIKAQQHYFLPKYFHKFEI